MSDEVPRSFARFIGHVCGVCAVGMAAASAYGAWAVAHKFSTPGLLVTAVGMAIAALLFRWAGALIGYWDTSGRLAVPALVYVCFGGLSAAATLFGVFVLVVDMPTSFGKAFGLWTGVLSGVVFTYLCVLASRRFK
jgi:hypothetical protein